jgi:hypothetical protein
MTKNYSLIIWDKLANTSDGQASGIWEIIVYKQKTDSDGFVLPDKSKEVSKIILEQSEVKQLTLGVSEEEGGDYMEADYFLIDTETFFDTYLDIPDRLKTMLSALPEYEIKKEKAIIG